jgi:hypothetical protein
MTSRTASVTVAVPSTFRAKSSLALRVSWGDDRGELGSAYVADDAARRGVQPADDSGRVDVVARDIDVLEHLLKVGGVERR